MTHKMSPLKQKMVTDVIRKEGLNLSDFEFNPITNDSFNLVYKPHSQYNFKHTRSINGQSIYHLCPGPNGDLNFVVQPKKFDNTLEALKKWLGYLKENLTVGNPWADLTEMKKIIADYQFDTYEEMFSDEDIHQIENKLLLLSDKLDTLQISNDIIQEDIRYLNEMSGKMSKKGWSNMLVGTFLSWFVNGIAPANFFPQFFDFVNQIFSQIKFLKL